jgi:hypothetical protein
MSIFHTNMSQFSARNGSLTATPEGNFIDTNPLRKVSVLGVSTTPSKVLLGGHELDASSWTYDEKTHLLVLEDLKEHFPKGPWSSQWTLTWA